LSLRFGHKHHAARLRQHGGRKAQVFTYLGGHLFQQEHGAWHTSVLGMLRKGGGIWTGKHALGPIASGSSHQDQWCHTVSIEFGTPVRDPEIVAAKTNN
jgi:hypothetical protein